MGAARAEGRENAGAGAVVVGGCWWLLVVLVLPVLGMMFLAAPMRLNQPGSAAEMLRSHRIPAPAASCQLPASDPRVSTPSSQLRHHSPARGSRHFSPKLRTRSSTTGGRAAVKTLRCSSRLPPSARGGRLQYSAS